MKMNERVIGQKRKSDMGKDTRGKKVYIFKKEYKKYI